MVVTRGLKFIFFCILICFECRIGYNLDIIYVEWFIFKYISICIFIECK